MGQGVKGIKHKKPQEVRQPQSRGFQTMVRQHLKRRSAAQCRAVRRGLCRQRQTGMTKDKDVNSEEETQRGKGWG